MNIGFNLPQIIQNLSDNIGKHSSCSGLFYIVYHSGAIPYGSL